MVPLAFESACFRAKNPSGQIAIVCVEIRERSKQEGDVLRRVVKVDVMVSENFKCFFEL